MLLDLDIYGRIEVKIDSLKGPTREQKGFLKIDALPVGFPCIIGLNVRTKYVKVLKENRRQLTLG